MHRRVSILLFAAVAFAACGRGQSKCPVGLDCPSETDTPCHTSVRGTFSQITLSLDADAGEGAPIRVVPARGEERNLATCPVSFDGNQEKLVLRIEGSPDLELRFTVAGEEPTAVVACTPQCEVKTKSTRTGHDTGEAESLITLPASFGGRVVRMTGRLSISVAECH